MEGFNAVPEPARPEDEGRIDDVEKAREMAEAGDSFRSEAADNRKQLSDGTLPEWLDGSGQKLDSIAESREDRVGREFELKQRYPDLSDEEIGFIGWKQDEKRTSDQIQALFKERFGKDLN